MVPTARAGAGSATRSATTASATAKPGRAPLNPRPRWNPIEVSICPDPCKNTRISDRQVMRLAGPSGDLVIGAVATFGWREASALGGDRSALHAVGRRDLELDLALSVELAIPI